MHAYTHSRQTTIHMRIRYALTARHLRSVRFTGTGVPQRVASSHSHSPDNEKQRSTNVYALYPLHGDENGICFHLHCSCSQRPCTYDTHTHYSISNVPHTNCATGQCSSHSLRYRQCSTHSHYATSNVPHTHYATSNVPHTHYKQCSTHVHALHASLGPQWQPFPHSHTCLLYTSDAADES